MAALLDRAFLDNLIDPDMETNRVFERML